MLEDALSYQSGRTLFFDSGYTQGLSARAC